MSLKISVDNGDFPHVSDAEAIRLLAAEFGSELRHLKNASTTVESGSRAAPGYLDEDGKSPSRFLFKRDFHEVNRTITSMLALKWILADDYTSFTAGQHVDRRLSHGSFQAMREYFCQQLRSHDDEFALLVATVVDDIGKDPQLATNLASKRELEGYCYNNNSPGSQTAQIHPCENHSKLLFDSAKAGIVPLSSKLTRSSRDTVLQCLEIGGKLNISQLTQGEGVPANLTVARTIQANGYAFDMRFMVTLLDVAGAGAHRDARGCIVMTEAVYQTYMSTMQIVKELIGGSIPDERTCYDRVLDARIKYLQQKGFRSLTTGSARERAIMRILCMGRVDTPDLANSFIAAFDQLSEADRQRLCDGLSVDGLNDGVAILPYYAPGLLSEVLRSVKDRKNSPAVVKAVNAFMSFLARVFDGSKPQPGTPGTVVERDLSFAQDVIKDSRFADEPSLLDYVEFPWRHDPEEAG